VKKCEKERGRVRVGEEGRMIRRRRKKRKEEKGGDRGEKGREMNNIYLSIEFVTLLYYGSRMLCVCVCVCVL
jgi:hypothetical protein